MRARRRAAASRRPVAPSSTDHRRGSRHTTISPRGGARAPLHPAAVSRAAMRGFAASMLTAAALAVLATGCQAPESGASIVASESRPIVSRDLDKVTLGKTSRADVEQLFGLPQERLANDDLLYRWTVHSGEEGQVTFKFERGVLSKLCKHRA